MPGAIPHLLAGCAMFFVGWLYFRTYFKDERAREKLLLLVVCLVFSCIPDFFFVLYFTFNVLSHDILSPYHVLLHFIITPVSIIVLLLLQFKIDVKRKPIWIVGFICILVHIIMDLFIHEHSMWI